VIILCDDLPQMLAVTKELEGQLTATVHTAPDDHVAARALLTSLEKKAGRILFNGFPTGVEVAHAMVHGGPFHPHPTVAVRLSVPRQLIASCARSAIRRFHLISCLLH
jgi:acyl-CoA reductase-like NAD-dependent aldehyde dehydrogenase